MNLTKGNDNTFTFEGENRTIILTANELHNLVTLSAKLNLRDRIIDSIHDEDGDTIDMSKYPYSFDEFIDEIYVELYEVIECDGGNPSDKDITDKIIDIADFYEMTID